MTVGELDDKVRELAAAVDSLKQQVGDSAKVGRDVVEALATSGVLNARVAKLESRVAALDGQVAS